MKHSCQLQLPPLSLYVHIPWCVRKCPYCDFNSHVAKTEIPTDDYVKALADDLNNDKEMAQGRPITSIFFGGGTPSLLPNSAIASIIDMVDNTIGIDIQAEITLEANPGTVEYHDFSALRNTGVNRLSLGVQSFNSSHLQRLGRIHSAQEAESAINRAVAGGFSNFNIDLMHGLPQQSVPQAISDLNRAISLQPTHLSWYQLTIEQNTEFYSKPPALPQEDLLLDIFQQGQQTLTDAGYKQYEVSAYAKSSKASRHNMNYWQFGDYMAIGAGAHGKVSMPQEQRIFRYRKTRLPKDYLAKNKRYTAHTENIASENLTLEFMMNALRLNDGIELSIYSERTGLKKENIMPKLKKLTAKGLLLDDQHRIIPSSLGRNFLNTLLESFI
ncbi:radical SAM family heme chaperone HemW [Agarilytica rhodophyticola]|uniref:radical SAM family heme chaperone HemW n=1 Tax=Agarilytica rhodophyticola TaxID=1737490 RepID=UPI000B345FE4|nr:radical SAM family heme chaperone HemW [Agarilytica rhodophyticola]